MKKNLLSLLALVGLLTATTGCSRQSLEDAVRAADLQCPVEYGAAGSLEKIFLEDDNVVLYQIMNEELFNLSALKETPDAGKPDAKTMLIAASPVLVQLMESAVSSGTPFKYRYYGPMSRTKAEFTLTTDELRECLRLNKATPYEKLQHIASQTNAQMPISVTSDVTIDTLLLEPTRVVYLYNVNSAAADLDQLANNVDQALESVRKEVHDMGENDPAFKAFITFIIEANMGLTYRYTKPDTQKYVDVGFDTHELQVLMHLAPEDEEADDGHGHSH